MNRLSLTLIVAAIVCMVGLNIAQAADDKRVSITAGKVPASSLTMDEWIEQTKNPTDWWSWGADLRLRTIYMNNATSLNHESATNERNFQRYRARWWSKFDLMKMTDTDSDIGLDMNIRLTWEGRTYMYPDRPGGGYAFQEWYPGTTAVDHLNFKVTNLLDLPLTLTVGRQDLILGNGWLVLDGTPLDGSKTIFFDAIRANWKPNETNIIDFIFLNNSGQDDGLFSPINDIDEDLTEQDERGVILYWTNKDIENTELNGYFMYKNNEPVSNRMNARLIKVNGVVAPWRGDDGEIFCVGARGVHDFNDNWKLRAEGAYQFGSKARNNGQGTAVAGDLNAFGFNSRLTYSFNDEYKTQIRGSYEYLSGDDPDTSDDEQWDPMWARWPQFSELYVYTYGMETRIAEITNLHRLALGVSTHPIERVEVCADYHLMFADDNAMKNAPANFSRSGKTRGHLLAGLMRYKINPHMYGHVVAELFVPGNYYTNPADESATFLRAELTLNW